MVLHMAMVIRGNDPLGDVHEEMVITNSAGAPVDYKAEPSHSAESGQTYIGGGWGSTRLPGGTANWSLRVIGGDGYLGATGGSFTDLKPLDN